MKRPSGGWRRNLRVASARVSAERIMREPGWWPRLASRVYTPQEYARVISRALRDDVSCGTTEDAIGEMFRLWRGDGDGAG